MVKQSKSIDWEYKKDIQKLNLGEIGSLKNRQILETEINETKTNTNYILKDFSASNLNQDGNHSPFVTRKFVHKSDIGKEHSQITGFKT